MVEGGLLSGFRPCILYTSRKKKTAERFTWEKRIVPFSDVKMKKKYHVDTAQLNFAKKGMEVRLTEADSKNNSNNSKTGNL